jgi:2'-5' RNA ligase
VRLFVAVDVGEQVALAAARLAGELRDRLHHLAPAARVTWASVERMHITITFIGQVDDVRARLVADLLQAPLDDAPFAARIAGVGAFPPSGPPRVFWAGVDHGRERLVSLEHRVAELLAPAGVRSERRVYQPHLTLGRVREAAALRSRALLEGFEHTVLGTTQVQAITLFESRLSPKGPTYAPLQRVALRPAV